MNRELLNKETYTKKISNVSIYTHCVGLMEYKPDLIYNTELYIKEDGNVTYRELSYHTDRYGEIDFHRKKVLREEKTAVDPESINTIFNTFKDFLDEYDDGLRCLDTGDYEIVINYNNRTYLTKRGDLMSAVKYNDIRFNSMLDKLIDIDDMVVLSWHTAKMDDRYKSE